MKKHYKVCCFGLVSIMILTAVIGGGIAHVEAANVIGSMSFGVYGPNLGTLFNAGCSQSPIAVTTSINNISGTQTIGSGGVAPNCMDTISITTSDKVKVLCNDGSSFTLIGPGTFGADALPMPPCSVKVAHHYDSNTDYYAYTAHSVQYIPAPAPADNPPSNLLAVLDRSIIGKVNLLWTDNSGSEVGFQIERSVGGSGTFEQITSMSANQTSYVDNIRSLQNLTGDISYRVRAVFDGDKYSDYSEVVKLSLLPTIPYGLNVKYIKPYLTLSWMTSKNNAGNGYEIEEVFPNSYPIQESEWFQIDSVALTDTNIVLPIKYVVNKPVVINLVGDTPRPSTLIRHFRVRSYNQYGKSAYSNVVKYDLAQPQLRVNKISNSNIVLSWNAPPDADGFKVYRSVNTVAGGEPKVIVELPVKTRTYTDKSPIVGGINYYSVKAYNSVTESLLSDTYKGSYVDVTPPEIPALYLEVFFTQMRINNVVSYKPIVRVEWNESSDDNDNYNDRTYKAYGYELYRYDNSKKTTISTDLNRGNGISGQVFAYNDSYSSNIEGKSFNIGSSYCYSAKAYDTSPANYSAKADNYSNESSKQCITIPNPPSSSPAPKVNGVVPDTSSGTANTFKVSGSGFNTSENLIKLIPVSSGAMISSNDRVANIFSAFEVIWEQLKNLVPFVHGQTTVGTGYYLIDNIPANGASLSFAVPSNVPDGKYKVSVSGVDSLWTDTSYTIVVSGNGAGDPSTIIVGELPPLKPLPTGKILKLIGRVASVASTKAGEVTLSWTVPSGLSIPGYNLYNSDSTGLAIGAPILSNTNLTTYTVTGLIPGKKYCWSVQPSAIYYAKQYNSYCWQVFTSSRVVATTTPVVVTPTPVVPIPTPVAPATLDVSNVRCAVTTIGGGKVASVTASGSAKGGTTPYTYQLKLNFTSNGYTVVSGIKNTLPLTGQWFLAWGAGVQYIVSTSGWSVEVKSKDGQTSSADCIY